MKLVEPKLKELNIPLFVVKGKAEDNIPKIVKDTTAALLVTDFEPLRDGRRWRDTVSFGIGITTQFIAMYRFDRAFKKQLFQNPQSGLIL